MARVLIAYASKRGSTAEIADAVARTIREAGHIIDCRPADGVKNLGPYDAVVLGSAVYMKRWRGDAKHFMRKHSHELAETPFWVFSSGPVGDPTKDADSSWYEPPRVIERAEALGLRGHVVFGGCVPTEPKGPLERAMVENTPPEYRDRRDWVEIRQWAHQVACEIAQINPAPSTILSGSGESGGE
jgi:menaquinone-dependent protoporphyrinogen oxidase